MHKFKHWTWKIYKITCLITKKVYIGQTKFTINIRFDQHKQKAMEGSHLQLHSAMRNFGIENFMIELVKDGIQSPQEADYWEMYYIFMYDSFHNGYNMTIGGEGVYLLDWNDMKKVRKLYFNGSSIQEIAMLFKINPEDVAKSLARENNYYGDRVNPQYLANPPWSYDPNKQ